LGLQKVVANEFGLPAGTVAVVLGDTRDGAWDIGNVASRVLYTVGNSLIHAARNAKGQLIQGIAQALGVNQEKIEIVDGMICIDGIQRMTISEGVRALNPESPSSIVGLGEFEAEAGRTLDKSSVEGYLIGPMPTYAFATHIVEIEVDEETGAVRVLRVIAVHDTGMVLDLIAVIGQIEGGVVMGCGAALLEELMLDSGRTKNPNLADYRVPTSFDIPEIIPIFVQNPHNSGPLGAKGVGEMSYLPIVPAIINAIADATGVRIRDLPANPERVFQAISSNKTIHIVILMRLHLLSDWSGTSHRKGAQGEWHELDGQ
jgi:CO/xanthine dehydrogenase Mo-binding subunit